MHVPLEGFQPWVLAGLSTLLPFDHALWITGCGPSRTGASDGSYLFTNGSGAPAGTSSTDLVRDLEPLIADTIAVSGKAVNVCLSNATWQQTTRTALTNRASPHGWANVVGVASAELRTGAMQCILLARSARENRFAEDETRAFEVLAPHAMQALATCRALSMASATARDGHLDGWSTAIVDRVGMVRQHDAGFVPALQMEWPDWNGQRLPTPLREGMALRNSAHWQYLGQRVMLEFSAVDDLWLAAVRPRLAGDALSAREFTVARQYATGATYREIAAALRVSPSTVRAHLRSVYAKLGVRNKVQVADRLR
jgi:DNA-binding CsgD family transcriptional regulator